MRPHLGTGLYDEFVEHENWHYKAGCSCARSRPNWALRGHPRWRACTHAAMVDLRAGAGTGVGREREVGKSALDELHLDHEWPLP